MRLSVEEASALARQALCAIGFDDEAQAIIADHLIDSTLRGEPSGLVPVLLIANRKETSRPTSPITITFETEISAHVDGGDNIGLLAAHRAVDIAIEKAVSKGIGIVGLNNTFTTGNLAYHIERATRHGLVALAAGNGMPVVAPHGAAEAVIGTNPIAIGFPTTEDPIIWDVGSSAFTYGDVVNANRDGHELPEGVALNAGGQPTTDPAEALKGALRTWGDHRGSGLGMIAQLLGILAGTQVQPPFFRDFGFFFLTFKPGLLGDAQSFLEKASEFRHRVNAARPLQPGVVPRVPYQGSLATRERLSGEGIELSESVYRGLMDIIAGRPVTI